MSNEMKLLTALTEALGFDIEVERDYQELDTEVSPMDARCFMPPSREYVGDGCGQTLLIKKNKKYTTRLKSPIISYKVTKK
jgi:hypothetical protein